MPDATKITLSPQERQLVTDTGWILTKRSLIDKVYQLFGQLSERYSIQLKASANWLPADVVNSEPKIYKGENYLELPYVMLDHPRCFTGDDVFAIRTLFWWGNFFSLTLQLGGIYKAKFESRLLPSVKLKKENLYICIGDDPWQHHFESGNYRRLDTMDHADLEKEMQRKDFCKLAVKFPIDQWDEIPDLLEGVFINLLEALKT